MWLLGRLVPDHAGVRRFVFLSSVRAQSGPTAPHVLTEDLPPRPSEAYGASKLAAEQGLAALELDWVALRLATVYGPGMKGNMAELVRLARAPYPLPVGGLTARRSLLALENLTEAIVTVLSAVEPLRRPLLAAEPDPLTIAEMIAALRQGLGRGPGLVRVPESLLRALIRMAGRSEMYERLGGALVADASALTALGWQPRVETRAALAALMHRS